MDVNAVMEEIAARLKAAVPSLRKVYDYPEENPVAPSGVLALPAGVTFDKTFARGLDEIRLSLYVVETYVAERAMREKIVRYLNGSGAYSVKAALDNCFDGAEPYASCDTVQVVSPELDIITIGTVEHVAIEFTLIVIGQGAG